jgi:hypothetical protein
VRAKSQDFAERMVDFFRLTIILFRDVPHRAATQQAAEENHAPQGATPASEATSPKTP